MTKSLNRTATIFLTAIFITAVSAHAAGTATALIEKSEEHIRGKTFQARMTMKIDRPDSTRSMTLRTWTRGHDAALIKILEPAKDAGSGTLRLQLNLWQYLPKIERTIR